MRIVLCEAGEDYKCARDRAIRTPQHAAEACAEITKSDTEAFVVLCLDKKNGLKAAEIVTMGLADATLIHPREVFRPALLRSSGAICIAHNHPSGDSTPSAEDIRITRQLIEVGRIMDVPVLDHVVVGRDSSGRLTWSSMREMGLLSFVA